MTQTKTTKAKAKTPKPGAPPKEPRACMHYEPRREFDCERYDCIHYPEDPLQGMIDSSPACKHFHNGACG